MKNFITFLTLFISLIGISQDSIPRVPLVEVFTSSTCPPCRPGNIGIKAAYYDDTTVAGRYTIVKYQMNWPGNGDPYYTSECGTRRGAYGVNGVPRLFLNGQTDFQPTSTMNNSQLKAEMNRYSYLKITPHVKVSNGGKTFHFDVKLKALQDIVMPASRTYIAIVETHTTKNKKTNGETSFEHVFKKLIPSTGFFVIGNMPKDTVIHVVDSFTFKGNYRLPNSAQDPIDHSKEHSVEDFNNLRVLVWTQELSTKEVLNSAWGYDKDNKSDPHHPENPSNPLGTNYQGPGPTALNAHPNSNLSLQVYPNPSHGSVYLVSNTDLKEIEITLSDINGRVVWKSHDKEWDAHTPIQVDVLESGVYFLQLNSLSQSWTQKVIVE